MYIMDDESNVTKKDILECKKLLKILSQLISNEEILIGTEKNFFLQKLNLSDLILLSISIVKEEKEQHLLLPTQTE